MVYFRVFQMWAFKMKLIGVEHSYRLELKSHCFGCFALEFGQGFLNLRYFSPIFHIIFKEFHGELFRRL